MFALIVFDVSAWFTTLRDLGGILFSLASILFVAFLALHAYFKRRMPSHLHIALHFFREVDGIRLLKIPTMSRMVLPQIYPIILATWVLIRGRAWGRYSRFSPIVTINPITSRWRIIRFMCERGLFTARDVMVPLIRYLSESQTAEWLNRSKDIIHNTHYECPESSFVVGIVCGEDSPSVRALVMPLEELLQINPEGVDDIVLAPLYQKATGRICTLRTLRRAYDTWLSDPNSGICIAVVEL